MGSFSQVCNSPYQSTGLSPPLRAKAYRKMSKANEHSASSHGTNCIFSYHGTDSIHGHSCLLCQSRNNQMHMEEEAGQTWKRFCIYLSKRIVGNPVRERNSVNSISFLWLGERNILNICLLFHINLNKWDLSFKGIQFYSEVAELNTGNGNHSNRTSDIHPWNKNTLPPKPVITWRALVQKGRGRGQVCLLPNT